jgi:purine-cytosine permease-like protein
MPGVEAYGVEPIPDELRTTGWRDLFAINFTFFLNPVMYVLGALAVVAGGLPLWWAVAAMVLGQVVAFGCLVTVAQAGVDYGLPGQVAMRASLGFWGARLLSSPYRVVAATYWFAAQALAGAHGLLAVIQAKSGRHVSLVPMALALAVVHAVLAILGFDVMRYVLRVVLPLSLAFTAVLVGLYLHSDDPRFAAGRVLHSPDQHLTWTGFATFVTVACGSSLTLVANIADFCRYTPSRRDMRIGLGASAVLAIAVTTFVGAWAAAATGDTSVTASAKARQRAIIFSPLSDAVAMLRLRLFEKATFPRARRSREARPAARRRDNGRRRAEIRGRR